MGARILRDLHFTWQRPRRELGTAALGFNLKRLGPTWPLRLRERRGTKMGSVRRLRKEDRRHPRRRCALAFLLAMAFVVFTARLLGGIIVRGYFLALAAQFFEPFANDFKIVCSAWPFHRSSLSLALNIGDDVAHYVGGRLYSATY